MTANKRTPAQRLADRAQIARRYLQGDTQSEIARDLGISQQQVAYDLGKIQREWLQSALRDFDTLKAEQLARLDELERTYWQAWEHSQADLVHTFSETSDDEISVRAGRQRVPAHRKRHKEHTRTEQPVGNAAYLDGVQRCIAQRCRILGLLAPADVSVHGMHGVMTFNDLVSLAQQPPRPRLAVLPGGDLSPEHGSADQPDDA